MIEYLSKPEFYDIFGLMGFIFLLITSIYAVLNRGRLPLWSWIIILVIAIIGFSVDITMVMRNFLN
jgi:hypothetical protein